MGERRSKKKKARCQILDMPLLFYLPDSQENQPKDKEIKAEREGERRAARVKKKKSERVETKYISTNV